MESKAQVSDEIPTALPGSEDDNAREKLLLETTATESDVNSDEDEADLAGETVKPKKRRWQVMRTFAGFAVFVIVLVFAISWFFRIGWFAESKAQPVSR
ncbi:MAG: hypothetical protein ABI999_16335, partial [Acidobacteriota bacterium]